MQLSRVELPQEISFQHVLALEQDGFVPLHDWLAEEMPMPDIFFPSNPPVDHVALTDTQPVLEPGCWHRIPVGLDNIGLTVLNEAACYGGWIQHRDWQGGQRRHFDGQLTLSRRGEVTRASCNYMDGTPSISGDLIKFDDFGGMMLIPPWPRRRLGGIGYLLGNLHRHFGHFLLEGLGKLWLDRGLLDQCDHFLVYEDKLEPFIYQLLDLAGVPDDRIVHVAKDGFVIEKLIAPDPSMLAHRRIGAPQAATYMRIAQGIDAAKPARNIYLSRGRVGDRPLLNQASVEAMFASWGFEIIHPETLPVTDQIRLAREAAILAGPVGSQMYLAGFQSPGTRTLVFAPRNFYLKDDYLLALAGGRELKVVLGSAVDRHLEKNVWFWSVDVDLLEKALCALLMGGSINE